MRENSRRATSRALVVWRDNGSFGSYQKAELARESKKSLFGGRECSQIAPRLLELAPTGRASSAPRIFLTARTAFESKSPAGEIFLQPFEFENLKGGFHPSSDQNHPPAGSLFHP